MNPKLKLPLRIAAIFIIIAIIIQPYNLFCNISTKCQPVKLSSFWPKREGEIEAVIKFGIKSYVDKLDIKPEVSSLTTVSGRRNVMHYIAKNNSGHFMRFRMDFFTVSESLKDHITLYECPCSGQKRLKKDEEVILTAEFELDDEAIRILKEVSQDQDSEAVATTDADNIKNLANIIGFKVIPF